MKNYDDIDKLFREGVQQDYAYDESLWAQVEGSLPSVPGKKSFWNFNLNSILLVLVLLGFASMPSDNDKIDELLATKNTALSAEATTIQASSTSSAKNLNPATKKSTKPTEYPEAKAVFASTSTLENEEKNTTSTQIKAAEAQMSNERPAAGEKAPVKGPAPEILASNELGGLSAEQTSNAYSAEASQAVSTISEENSSAFEAINAQALETANNFASFGAETEQEADLELMLLEAAPFRTENELLSLEPQKTITPKLLPQKRQYYIELIASRSLQLSKTTESSRKEFEDFKNRSETTLHASNIGVNFLTHYRFLMLGVGVHVNSYSEEVDYSLQNPTADRISAQNDFRRIRLPLSIAYEKAFGSFSASLSTAFVVNNIFYQKGYYVDQDLSTIYNLQEGEEFYLLVFGHQLAGSLGYSLNEYLAVGMKLSYEYDLNSYTKDYDSKFQSQNLGFWLRIRPR